MYSNSANDSTEFEDMEEKRGTILAYGREMSDLIITSCTALSDLLSQFKSWQTSRKQLIAHFEELHKNLKKCSGQNVRYEEILRMANALADAAQGIPNPYVPFLARLMAMFTGVFSWIFRASDRTEDESNNILTAIFKDTQASNNLYASGLQCHQLFEETTKLIEKFHGRARELRYFDNENREMAAFVEGLLEYKPNHRTFYPKLQECLRELREGVVGEFGRRFCEPFSYNPSAVEVVRFLNWRFRYHEFNPESVRFGTEQLKNFINDNDVNVQDLTPRVKDLLDLLKDELDFIESSMKDVMSFKVQ